jgi:hypothetical protein
LLRKEPNNQLNKKVRHSRLESTPFTPRKQAAHEEGGPVGIRLCKENSEKGCVSQSMPLVEGSSK